ncbi:MAG: hypothetical protein H0V17_24925 [Deltaproteobacteria bacterium]|nr:hypothetical protein [Deltaproteobacteria bacterium]
MTRSLTLALVAMGIGLPRLAAADSGGLLPAMSPDKPVICGRDTEGKVWRIQCDAAAKVCIYAANEELSSSGRRTKPLERARDCEIDQDFDRKKLEASGYSFVQGRVDAPYGWLRDERGRILQVNFDLRKRIFFGAAYTPQKILDNPLESKRTSVDFGLLSFNKLSDGATPTMHRIRLVHGEVHVEPFSAEITIAHWDVSRRFLDPLLRLTTFVGQPQRHDLHLNLGLWTEAGGLEIHPSQGGHSTIWKHATLQGTLDLWQSPDLNSFVRVRSGIGLEGQHTDGTGYRSALVPSSAFEIDAQVDDDGFHNVKFEFTHEAPRYFVPFQNSVEGSSQRFATRLKAKLSYEAIILAINDQPLSIKLAAGGEKRDDIFGVPDQWAFVADAGLRFSLWAPPRDPTPRPAGP